MLVGSTRSIAARWGLAAMLCLGSSATAAKPGKSRRVPNMPRGWSWPPSAAMQEAGARCREELETSKVEFEPGVGKKIATPILIANMRLGELGLEPTWRKGPFPMDCHLARALHRLEPEIRALGIAALRFSTIHDYRHVRRNGRKTKILSRHAIGLAMDVFEVRLDDGRVLVVERDYAGDETLAGLEALFANSPDFRRPLTPGVDPKGHDDHFHLEARMPLPR